MVINIRTKNDNNKKKINAHVVSGTNGNEDNDNDTIMISLKSPWHRCVR